MKQSRQITGIILALLLLSLGNGQQVFLHWCGEQLEDWGLTRQEVACSMEMATCPMHQVETETEPCCTDTVVSLNLDDFSFSKFNLHFADLEVIGVRVAAALVPFWVEGTQPSYTSPIHGPPLLARNTRSHLQFRRLTL